jgi:hypothetical protein
VLVRAILFVHVAHVGPVLNDTGGDGRRGGERRGSTRQPRTSRGGEEGQGNRHALAAIDDGVAHLSVAV